MLSLLAPAAPVEGSVLADPVEVPVPADVSDDDSESTAPTLVVVDSSSDEFLEGAPDPDDTSVFVLLGPG